MAAFQLVGLVAGVSGIQAANPCSSCPVVRKPKPKFGCCPEKKVRDGRLPPDDMRKYKYFRTQLYASGILPQELLVRKNFQNQTTAL